MLFIVVILFTILLVFGKSTISYFTNKGWDKFFALLKKIFHLLLFIILFPFKFFIRKKRKFESEWWK